jgi:hypothetical protein
MPLYAGTSSVARDADALSVTIAIRAAGNASQLVPLTDVPPPAALEHSAHRCVDRLRARPGFGQASAVDCGWPEIIGRTQSTYPGVSRWLTLRANASIGADGSSIVLRVAHAPRGFVPEATAYGRASWPMARFYSIAGALPVVPWYANLSTSNAYTPPAWTRSDALEERLAGGLRICGWVTSDFVSPVVAASCAEATRRACNKTVRPQDRMVECADG